MLKYTVALGLLVACCLAQPPEPERPRLPATFVAEYTAEEIYYDQTGEVRDYGTGWQAFDATAQRSVHNSTYYTRQGKELHYTLSLYELGKRFNMRGDNVVGSHCTNEDLFGRFTPYFNWVYDAARYKGTYEWNGRELDFWYVEVEADIHEVGVSPSDVDVPVAYIHHHGYQSRTSIHTYTYVGQFTPDPALFVIPDRCQMAGQTTKSHFRLRRSHGN